MVQWTHTSRIVDVDSLLDGPSLFRGSPATIMRTIIDSISDGIIILDRSGVVLYMNQEGVRILGLDQDAVIGKNVAEIVDFRPVILDVLESGKGYIEREFIIHSPSRGQLHFIKSAVVLRDKFGAMIGVIDTFRQIAKVHTMIARMTGAKAKFTIEDIVGEDTAFQEAVILSRMAAQSRANVLIEGESGTGKEMFAHAIHHASDRGTGPLIIVNCAALPRSLVESELFGYESGSFTGARREGFAGKFEQANMGTIFLDEIGELPLDTQAKLLRVLQDRTFSRIGGTKSITVDTRVIAATNKNLLTEIRNNAFREDLYYRLNVVSIRCPSLRERPRDIPLLAAYFARKSADYYGKTAYEIDFEVLGIFRDYPWPGNVRELENVIERAMIVAKGYRITPTDLPPHVAAEARSPGASRTACLGSEVQNLERVERDEIERALRVCEGNISSCSKLLGISRNTLYRKMKRYAL
ncbi:MAG TPA: sigma 54-interacting transcriptional regulator [Magnetospirillaceae bacterium]|nr:sigma 54-interacting transcriptional regulator [Magnetospirillaceae bacterium]